MQIKNKFCGQTSSAVILACTSYRFCEFRLVFYTMNPNWKKPQEKEAEVVFNKDLASCKNYVGDVWK